MCLMIVAHRAATDYPLVVAANRDEFHARPTAPSEFWSDHPALLAGRDLQQGGTWMGITRDGRFSAVTNYRDPAGALDAPRSRGDLPLAYLAGGKPPAAYLAELAARAADYAGFNLLVGDRESLWYFSNSDQSRPRNLPPGIYGLSNAMLDTPWPKVELGKARLGALLQQGALSHESLASVVADRELADPERLARLGLDGAMDPLLSAQFIVTDTYGTRSRTTLWLDPQPRAHWQEEGFNSEGSPLHRRREVFTLAEA
jgi:uncharacterized protein with NRDE domain